MMRAALAGMVALMLAGCTSNTGTANATPTSPPAVASAEASPTPSGPTVDRLQVDSIAIDVPLTEIPCTAALAQIPAPGEVDLAQCNGYQRIAAADPGVISALGSAPPLTTTLVYWDGTGSEHQCTLSTATSSVTRYPDGTFPGHELTGARPLLLDLRSTTHQTERIAGC